MAEPPVEEEVKKRPADEDTDAGDAATRSPNDSPPQAAKEEEQTSLQALSAFAKEYLTSFFSTDAALPGAKGKEAAPTQFAQPGGGGNWTRGENGWQFTDNNGKVVDKFGPGTKVNDLTMKDGVLVATMADGKIIKSHKDGSFLEYTDDKLTKINYADGRVRELRWNGNDLDKVTSTKGEWFTHEKNAKGEYIDSWKNETTKVAWKGNISVPDQEKGDYVLTGSDASSTGPITFLRDGSQKTVARDGSYEIKHPSGAVEGFDAAGEMSSLTGPDKVKREFGRSKDGKNTLESIKVTDAEGKVNNWALKDGVWNWNGEPTKFTFKVDSKTGTYSYFDPDNDKTTTVTAKSKEVSFGDGTEVKMNAAGDVGSASKGDTKFEYVRDKNGVTEIRETKNGEPGRTWTKNSAGKWTDGKQVLEGALTVTDRGEPSFGTKDKSILFKLDGRSVEQIKNADNSTVEKSDGRVKITAPDGSTRELFTKKDEQGKDIFYKEVTVRDGKTQTWERQTKAAEGGGVEYTNEWKNAATGEVEDRKQMTLSATNELSVEYGDGSKYTAKTNGNERRENAAEKWSIDLENGKPVKVKFADGTERTYKWKGNTVESMVVSPPGGAKPSTWTRIGEKQYKYEGSSTGTTNGTIDIDAKGKYVFNDFDEKSETARFPNGKILNTDKVTGVQTEKVGTQLDAIRKDGEELAFARDDKGKVNEIKDTKSNTKWSKQADGSWEPTALDDKKPWNRPDAEKRVGDVVIGEKKGSYSFLGADGSVFRHSFTGVEKIGGGTDFEKEIVKDDRLTDQEKILFVESLDGLAKRDLSDKEKADTLDNIKRTFHAKDDAASPFSSPERAQLAGQMAWHVANASMDAQGQRPNCNITDIRVALEHETPAAWSKMTADMITKGQFKTADGTIVQPKDPQSLRPTDAEKTFPPADGDRSWLGKISDVTMLDIHWQRRSTDAFGNAVTKGTMTYEEVKPTDADDSGGRIYRYYQENGQWKRSEQKRAPNVYGKDIMDIYKQITGREEENRFIINSDQNQKGGGVTAVGSVKELEAALSKGPWPKIIQVQNDVLYSQKHDGKEHCHVVVVLGVKDGKALIDNTHNSKWDRLKPGEGIPLAHLFEATKKRGDAVYEPVADKNAKVATVSPIGTTTTVSNNQIRYQSVQPVQNVRYNNGYNNQYYNNGYARRR